MSEAVREMTREELIAEKAKLEEQCRILANRCDMKECQMKEMQSHIKCLQDELEEVQIQKVDLPTEPIKVADMLIDKFTSISGEYVRTAIENEYPVNDTTFYSMRQQEVKILRQIAEHLLVYCNHAEVEELWLKDLA